VSSTKRQSPTASAPFTAPKPMAAGVPGHVPPAVVTDSV
jgi:hypothetical protein